MEHVHKAVAIVVREDGSVADTTPALLIFDHPDSPPQLPKGGFEAPEEPAAAALRELTEETGVRDVRIAQSLGVSSLIAPGGYGDGPLEVQHWHMFLMRPTRTLPTQWDHRVTGGGEDDGFLFRCRWLPLDEAASAAVHPLMAFVVAAARQAHVAAPDRAHCPACRTPVAFRSLFVAVNPLRLRCRTCDTRLKADRTVLVLGGLVALGAVAFAVLGSWWLRAGGYGAERIVVFLVATMLFAFFVGYPATNYALKRGRYGLR